MTAQEAKTITGFLSDDMAGEIETTLRVLAAVPGEALEYRPDGTSKTALQLVRHIALEDTWLLDCIANGVFVPPPDDSDACGIGNPAEAIAYYREKTPAALDRVRAMTGEQLAAVLDLFGMIQATGTHFLSMTVKHSVHHRGQLTAYLRAMGGRVPGIYGPSADTQ